MISVIVKENGVVIGKEVYAGDTSVVAEKLDVRAAQDAALSFEIFDESRTAEFEAVQMVSKPDPAQADWTAAKMQGADACISFIAKKLGLE